ncbi:alpha-hydroxy acid oxidase [Algirhabdus cladophorae]|uniref:alpha-hydroxy acid oxidase n=1 Tax=Algirhabdus cladophorae TaxID=3377108 RepID=UPI003B846141
MSLHNSYPALSDLRARAKRRIPHFVWEYLDSATGHEATKARNRAMLDEILFTPSILHGEIEPDLSTELLGRTYQMPVGVAPVGMSGLIWPGAEQMLARTMAREKLPYGLSTVASQLPEDVGPHAGDQGWFQIYPPRDPVIRDDILRRAKDSGFHTLIMTLDVPAPSRRERQTRGGLQQPPKITPRLALQVATCPEWLMGIQKTGMPRLKLMESYSNHKGSLPSNNHIGYLLRTSPDWDYLEAMRKAWDGPLVVKGVQNPDDVARLESCGVDAIWVSNHAGRQFDGGPATIEVLEPVADQANVPVIFDSGVEGGLDILRALAKGADFVMMGSGFHYALGALGEPGAAHLLDILRQDMISNMQQIGAKNLSDVKQRLR